MEACIPMWPIPIQTSKLLFSLLFIISHMCVGTLSDMGKFASPQNHFGVSTQSQFTTKNNTRVIAQKGGLAVLPCVVKVNSPATVSWIRRKDFQLLTVGLSTHSSDKRFLVEHTRHMGHWSLRIKSVREDDRGFYECQLSIYPTQSIFVELKVVEAVAEITGAPDLHIDEGSTLRLECKLKRATENPAFVFWYHDNKMVNYDTQNGFSVTSVTSSNLPMGTTAAVNGGGGGGIGAAVVGTSNSNNGAQLANRIIGHNLIARESSFITSSSGGGTSSSSSSIMGKGSSVHKSGSGSINANTDTKQNSNSKSSKISGNNSSGNSKSNNCSSSSSISTGGGVIGSTSSINNSPSSYTNSKLLTLKSSSLSSIVAAAAAAATSEVEAPLALALQQQQQQQQPAQQQQQQQLLQTPQQLAYLLTPSSSILTIQEVHFHHGGNYTCAPSNARPNSITVHVLRGERPAAMQHANRSSLDGEHNNSSIGSSTGGSGNGSNSAATTCNVISSSVYYVGALSALLGLGMLSQRTTLQQQRHQLPCIAARTTRRDHHYCHRHQATAANILTNHYEYCNRDISLAAAKTTGSNIIDR